ncbi:MAG: hypothetical protein NT155_01630 [Candidatus Staskawiczbacteria bacterium]|nr:hypothetical protein [Candidatus Staskawiczbacteria bacterium]
MILLVHLLFGAAIGSAIKNIPLAIILAFLSHYFLDLFPHIEYPIENLRKKQWDRVATEVLSIFLDFCLGILIIIFLAKNQLFVYVCALLAIIPDGLTVLSYLFPNKVFTLHDIFHRQKIHFLKDKKISNFWRITSQILAAIISIAILIS